MISSSEKLAIVQRPDDSRPLADPARPLHVRRAHAQVLELHHQRPVRVQGQDAGAEGRVTLDGCHFSKFENFAM